MSIYTDLRVIGIDIGKDVFHLVGFDGEGNVVLRRKIRRLALTDVFNKLPRCIVGMEACLSAHFVSRTLRRLDFGPQNLPAFVPTVSQSPARNSYTASSN